LKLLMPVYGVSRLPN